MSALALTPGSVVLLAGYRQHGKDTFFRHISGVESGRVYKVTADGELFYFPQGDYRRVAFADLLKQECADILGMYVDELEEHKDGPLQVDYAFKCTPAPVNPTNRDVLIDHAAYCRALDPDHYVRRACEQLRDDCVTVVTDFRYPNEYDFLRVQGRSVVTAWLTREGAPVPSLSVASEHQLDNFYFQIQIECLYSRSLLMRPATFSASLSLASSARRFISRSRVSTSKRVEMIEK